MDARKYKVLPRTRAQDFLKIIMSFAGLIEPFSNPDLSLYYTLTRKCLFVKINEGRIGLKSDAPLVDVGHFLLEVEIDAKIDPEGDPVSSDTINLFVNIISRS